MFDDVARHYEEISADILMKERYGDHLTGKTILEKFNNEFDGVSTLVKRSFESWGGCRNIGELCSYRAKAEIFGLSDIKAEIDLELKMQHGIDVNSSNDSIGKRMNDLTNAYCELQGLDKDKFKTSFKNIVIMSINLDGGGKYTPPGV